jgi:hypothetical protein
LACDYASKHPVGTPDTDQILTDVNNEFAQYGLFVCRKEIRLVHMDILDAHFDNKCPSDKSDLEPIAEPEHAKCPRCGKELKVEDTKPLAASEGSMK